MRNQREILTGMHKDLSCALQQALPFNVVLKHDLINKRQNWHTPRTCHEDICKVSETKFFKYFEMKLREISDKNMIRL